MQHTATVTPLHHPRSDSISPVRFFCLKNMTGNSEPEIEVHKNSGRSNAYTADLPPHVMYPSRHIP